MITAQEYSDNIITKYGPLKPYLDKLDGMKKKELKELADKFDIFYMPRSTAKHLRCLIRNAYVHVVIMQVCLN